MYWWNILEELFGRDPNPLVKHNHEIFRNFNYDFDIESYDFVVFDTEFTGLDPSRDEIVSIAAVKIESMRIALDRSFHSLMGVKKKLMGEGTFVHKITPELIRNAPDPKDVLHHFFEYCGNSVLVEHLPDLDFSFLDRQCSRIMGGVIHNPCLDSMALAKALWKKSERNNNIDLPKIDSFNLLEVSRSLGIPLFPSHNALGDALQTACLFLYLVHRLKCLGYRSLKDFYKLGGVR